MSEQWKAGDTAWVWDGFDATKCEIVSLGYPYYRAKFLGGKAEFNERPNLFYSSEHECLKHTRNLAAVALQDAQEQYESADAAFVKWQAQQNGGGE